MRSARLMASVTASLRAFSSAIALVLTFSHTP